MNKRIIEKALFVAVVLALVLVMLYCGIKLLETENQPSNAAGTGFQTKTVEYQGQKYFPRQDITVVMVLGIDQRGEAVSSGGYRNEGSADMVTLLVFDRQRQVCDLLCLNRDSMVTMPVLGIGGRQAGTMYGQLALSHTYGSGLEDSCENTRKTVSDLLLGIEIDYYVALRMDGIALLNDGVGGVTVEVTDDFSAVTDDLPMGLLTLTGQQAVQFVQSRKDVGTQLNLSRMERQKQYMEGFVAALKAGLKGDSLYASKLYDRASAYIVTDCSAAVLNRLAADYGEYSLGRVISPAGENIQGDPYYEFHLEEEALKALAIEVFFEPKQ